MPVTPSINCRVHVTPLPGKDANGHFGKLFLSANYIANKKYIIMSDVFKISTKVHSSTLYNCKPERENAGTRDHLRKENLVDDPI